MSRRWSALLAPLVLAACADAAAPADDRPALGAYAYQFTYATLPGFRPLDVSVTGTLTLTAVSAQAVVATVDGTRTAREPGGAVVGTTLEPLATFPDGYADGAGYVVRVPQDVERLFTLRRAGGATTCTGAVRARDASGAPLVGVATCRLTPR